jgi:maltose O-acetyltransferase
MSEHADGRSQLQRMLAGDLYLADDPEIDAMAARARRLVALFNGSGPDESADRREILEELLGSIGPDTEIRVPFHCDFGANLRIGARCFANFGLVVLDVAPVTIGDDVQIGPNVQLLTPTHPLDAELRRAKWEAAEPITIGDNVWLGGGATGLPGVSIGADAVVGAGSVVTRDVAPNVVVAGNPARVIRTL